MTALSQEEILSNTKTVVQVSKYMYFYEDVSYIAYRYHDILHYQYHRVSIKYPANVATTTDMQIIY